MPPLQRLSATRSRMFRRSEGPQTPEPQTQGVPEQPPSPPRQRFRLKKRNAPHLNTAPTQDFLESVEAADVPIPSIEGPILFNETAQLDGNAADPDIMDLSGSSLGLSSVLSPPKTPAPESSPYILSAPLFPDWSTESICTDLESSPEYESSRPSTARSTLTSASIFSRYSITSDDLSDCASPLAEQGSYFGDFLSVEDANKTIRAPAAPPSQKKKAPWTKPMSDHLWSTYMMYLQDPTVTPIRIGKSAIPPHGVLLRVAREARRSWKGPAALTRSANHSGSLTPTREDTPRTFIMWPHTDGATRAHLRDLCRANAGSTTRTSRYLACSPTPHSRFANRRSRRSTPARSSSIFSSSDMAMSLTLSTSESMQAQGPLAQLTGSEPQLPISEELPKLPVQETPTTPESVLEAASPPSGPRLGSPFVAKSYGPSSSSSLAEVLGHEVSSQRQNHTVGPRRSLRSPAKLDRSRSNTLKRRPRQAKVELRRSKRPSLASDMWNEPTANPVMSPQELSSAASSRGGGDIFVPSSAALANVTATMDTPQRLGSPFSGMSTSFSFPTRFFRPRGLDFGLGDDSSTDNQTVQSGSATAPRSSLPSRLAYIDQRLRDFRRRDEGRQGSPF